MVQSIGPTVVEAHAARVETSERAVLKAREDTDRRVVEAQASGQAVELSPRLRELQRAIETVKQAPDVRAERVAEIRQALATGRYSLDPSELAARLVAKLRPDLT